MCRGNDSVKGGVGHLEHVEMVLDGLRPLLQVRHVHAEGAHKLHTITLTNKGECVNDDAIMTLTNHAERATRRHKNVVQYL